MQIRTLASCSVCGGSVNEAVHLPNLPLTGIYSAEGYDASFPAYDQALMVCETCNHAQLREVLDDTALYGSSYGFRTSQSTTAREGSQFFATYLRRLLPERTFQTVVEFGCNDGVLLGLLEGVAKRRVGIDPILTGRREEFRKLGIEIIDKRIEDVDLSSTLAGAPDLVVSQHTLEHLSAPQEVVKKLLAAGGPETIFLFEFPCLDVLLRHFRFDQVFHQHIQYFSVQSFLELLYRIGAEPIDYTFNFGYWGALLIAFRKSAKPTKAAQTRPLVRTKEGITEACRERYATFKNQMELASRIIDSFKGDTVYGYGAALMLPILAYHLRTDFAFLRAILDDDPGKTGLGYANLPVKVASPVGLDLSNATVLLTAMDNRRPILRRLADFHPRTIVNPLCVL